MESEESVLVKRFEYAGYVNRMALRCGTIAGGLVGLTILIANWNRHLVPMFADARSFGIITFLMMVPIVFVVAGVTFYLGVKGHNDRLDDEFTRWWKFPIFFIALAYTILVTGILVVGALLMEHAFQYLELAMMQGVAIGAGISGTLTYFVVQQVMHIKTSKLLQLVLILVSVGIYLTMISIDDPMWWQVTFSYLGSYKSSANYIFNFTLVFGALLLLVWLRYVMRDFMVLVRNGIAIEKAGWWVRFLLAWISVAFGFVGFFPTWGTPFQNMMHNWSAYTMGAMFGVLMLAIRWLVPGFPKDFLKMSLVLVGLLVATMLFAAVGYFNTVGMEFICGMLGFVWLSLFVNVTEQMARQLEPKGYLD